MYLYIDILSNLNFAGHNRAMDELFTNLNTHRCLFVELSSSSHFLIILVLILILIRRFNILISSSHA